MNILITGAKGFVGKTLQPTYIASKMVKTEHEILQSKRSLNMILIQMNLC